MPIDLTNIQPHVPFKDIEYRVQQNIEHNLHHLSPGGQMKGSRYLMINTTRGDTSLGSFDYNIRNHFWGDHATTDKGWGYIGLVKYLQGMTFQEAAQWTLTMLGGYAPVISRTRVQPTQDCQVVIPVPLSEQHRVFTHKKWGNPVYSWDYRDERGRLVMYRNRYKTSEGSKYFLPFSYWETRMRTFSMSGWRAEDIKGKRTLYRLERLAEYPDAAVMICEGEKSADNAQKLFPDHVCMTSPCGAMAANRTDWTPILGRNIIVFPDNDEPGIQYGHDVQDLANQAGASSVKIMKYFDPAALPKGWDAADALAAGFSADTLRGVMSW